MPQIVLDARTFLKGVSVSDDLTDGGYSPNSKGINLFAKPGLITAGKIPVDAVGSGGGVATGGIFAWSTHPANVSPGIGRGLGNDSSHNGYFYTLSDAGAATRVTSDSGNTYLPQVSDLFRYGASNNQFSTSNTDVGMHAFDFSSTNFNWWTSTESQAALGANVPHNLFQFGSIMYITDGRYLHSWDGTTASSQVLILPVGYVINSAVVYQNSIMIAASRFSPLGGGEATDSRLFLWDGFSSSYSDEYVLQENIDTLILFGGTLLATTKTYIGYWTGSTIAALYPLSSQIFKYQFCVTNDRLYLLQSNNDLLCYGNPSLAHPKFFSFPLHNTNNLIGITSYRRGKIVYAYASQAGSYSDVNGSDQTGQTFYGNKIFLGGPASVKYVIVESELLTTGADMVIGFIDSTGTSVTLSFDYSYAVLGGKYAHVFRSSKMDVTYAIQPYITFSATPLGIRRLTYIYESTEFIGNK